RGAQRYRSLRDDRALQPDVRSPRDGVASKSAGMRFFEDLKVGERQQLGSHTFEAADIKTFASRYDPQPFHVDEDAAARSHFGRLCASGWHVGAVCMRLIALSTQREQQSLRARGEEVPAVGPSPGVRDLRWLRPVFAGDTISYALEIMELRDAKR